MSGTNIVSAIQNDLQHHRNVAAGYDNYQYPDSAGSYADDDADTSDSEK